ncbi:hypothetical protein K469DRAFT_706611 [Zopfia rhizophila CBS 207.26]|uniref:Uncharacterized protein n=1 Tax=Zopfia rhizophila CBS 207.26 TaxID=1314779 RepID=A0A6A6E9X2_9PEZI|nr:hypothetical protein K469DRAFT_706611 [Zopfia rhizophila CBS 207.26]
MVIDFERAEVVEPRTVLGAISANRKRKRGLESEGSLAKQSRSRYGNGRHQDNSLRMWECRVLLD